MGIFKKYFNKDANEVLAKQEALIEKKVARGFESTIDQLEIQKMETETKLEVCRFNVANGNVSQIITIGETLLELAEITSMIEILRIEQKAFFTKE